MLNAKEIQNAVFSDAMRGYKKDDVDALLDAICEDYEQFESTIAAFQNKIASLEKELSEKDTSMNSINTVLISAQKLADQIIADAKATADETVEKANAEAENIKLRTKKALEEIDSVLTEQKNKAQEEVDSMLADAARKSEGMILAAKDSVTREQLLFDKLKSEVAEFKNKIKDTYKQHLESLSKLPDEVVLNPELASSKIEDIINNEPDLLRFIEKTPFEVQPKVVEIVEEDTTEEEEEIVASVMETEPEVVADTAENTAPFGFVVQLAEDDEEEENLPKDFFTTKE